MSTALSESIGRADAVMLDEITDEAFINNLKIRAENDRIYSYIGEVLVSVNPYRDMGSLFSVDTLQSYRGTAMHQREPHIYAIAEQAYSTMRRTRSNCCVVISGESGAGKTEASKKIMEYIASITTTSTQQEVERVKEMLLASNPLLEAFGNAQTARNDNSSRFGKYMDIHFDFKFEPVGGHINNYLLEKARVIKQSDTDRNFHIFYMLLAGGGALLDQLGLASGKKYRYLSPGSMDTETAEDATGFTQVNNAAQALGFDSELMMSVWKIVSIVLLLGEIDFEAAGEHCSVTASQELTKVANLLNVTVPELEKALTHRVVAAAGEVHYSKLSAERADHARHALAKALYNELFTFLVGRVNTAITAPPSEADAGPVIGVLDIYGFEIFPTNGFEQFCINYCNEKLQQLFIELVMKREQEEYAREGIDWVDIDFFNNEVICHLVDDPKAGIIAILDEQCMVASGSDQGFLGHLDKVVTGKHDRLSTFQSDPASGCGRARDFKIQHFAGDVIYNTEGFVDKNNDTLFQDLKRLLYNSSGVPEFKAMFPEGADELTAVHKNPATAGTQFKESMGKLTTLLSSKEPFYVRCIKPNGEKAPLVFDDGLVNHQVRYLGLMENLRVRRAGYCNRQPYERFVQRYKMLTKQTWPHYRGDQKEGAQIIIKALGLEKEVAFGKTKLFIKEPNTLYFVEEKREATIPLLVAKIQACFRGMVGRRYARRVRAAWRIARYWKTGQSVRYFQSVLAAFDGCATRSDFGRGIKWPSSSGKDTWLILAQKIFLNWWARKVLLKYDDATTADLQKKATALQILGSRKKDWGFERRWIGNYMTTSASAAKFSSALVPLFSKTGDSNIEFASEVLLLNAKGKQEDAVIVVTKERLYALDKKFKLSTKVPIPLGDISKISLSTGSDQACVIFAGNVVLTIKLKGNVFPAELLVSISQHTEQELEVAVTDDISVTVKGKDTYLRFETKDGGKSGFKSGKESVTLFTRRGSVVRLDEYRSGSGGDP